MNTLTQGLFLHSYVSFICFYCHALKKYSTFSVSQSLYDNGENYSKEINETGCFVLNEIKELQVKLHKVNHLLLSFIL